MKNEVKLTKDTMIVSETDLKGKIIYVNSDFCKISGFTKNELIGKAHNMVRHLDMPTFAFKDLWQTIKNGKTWNGIVKNITKNGGFYWVNATVYPVQKSNGDKRFISVRVKATKEEISLSQEIYKKIRNEER